MTTGQAIVKSLRAHYVDTVFGLPGIQLDYLFNAFHDERNSLRIVHPRHEQAAGYMALGYAQATGRVGVFAVVPGPGLLNTTAAVATAYGCNAPVLALTGQIPSGSIGQGYGLLHEIPDQLGLIRGLVKWAARIEHVSEASSLVREAFAQLTAGVAKPVELEVAMDVLGRQGLVEILSPRETWVAPEPDPELITEAAKLLGLAKRPLIVCGGGVIGARESLLEVAEMLQAPVVSHRMGAGVVSDRHYLSQSLVGRHRLWADTDVVLAVGTRFQQQSMVWKLDDSIKVIRIDLDPVRIGQFQPPAVGIVADADQALRQLVESLHKTNPRRESREDELKGLKSGIAADLSQKLRPKMGFVRALREALPEDGIYVEELTQVAYVGRTMFPIYAPRTLLASGYQGTLGSGFPTALGAKVGYPDKPVLSVNGDGGFMFNVQELSTAAMHGIGVVAVIFNDNAFGNVKRMQEDLYEGRVLGSELRNPDFVKLGESFGIDSHRVKTPKALRAVLERAFSSSGPSLIEVPVGKMPAPWGVSVNRCRRRRENLWRRFERASREF